MLPATLRTARLTLRPVAAGDKEAVLTALNVFDVTRWLRTVPFPYSAEDFDHFLKVIAVPGQDFAIQDDEGFAGVVGFDRDREIGYWLEPRAQGRGYATEAAAAVLRAAFSADSRNMMSGYFVGNTRSARVLDKLGFTETCRSDEFCVAQGVAKPHVTLTLTAEEFLRVQGGRGQQQ